MHRHIAIFYIINLILFTMGGCDSFSLLDQFRKGLYLTLEKDTVKPGEECLLYPDNGKEPYSFVVIDDNLYDDGTHSINPGTVVNQTFTAGNSIGTVKIRVTDSSGNNYESIITILPWTPQDFVVDGSVIGPTIVDLTWTYTVPGYIGGFRILRSKSGGAFEEIADIGNDTFTYTDDAASPQMNSYHLYAVAGEFLSTYTEGSDTGSP